MKNFVAAFSFLLSLYSMPTWANENENNKFDVEKIKSLPISENDCAIDNKNTIKLIPTNISGYYFKSKINGSCANALLDTGAGVNLIGDGFARKLGLKVNNKNLKKSQTSTGEIQFLKHSFAKDLYLGNIKLHNIEFLVVDDNVIQQFAPNKNNEPLLILGNPTQKAIGKIEFNTNYITLNPKNLKSNKWQGFQYDGRTIKLPIIVNEVQGSFIFDTGANHTALSSQFMKNNPKIIEGLAPNKLPIGGLNGNKYVNTYKIPSVTLSVNGVEVRLSEVLMFGEEQDFLKNYDGIIGTDFMNHFESYTIDFKNTRIFFGKEISLK